MQPMTHPGTSAQSKADSANQDVFSPAEVAEFQLDDKRAATAIVVLMAGIFALGLLGYLGVCWWSS
jgi:hypothetical protein